MLDKIRNISLISSIERLSSNIICTLAPQGAIEIFYHTKRKIYKKNLKGELL